METIKKGALLVIGFVVGLILLQVAFLGLLGLGDLIYQLLF